MLLKSYPLFVAVVQQKGQEASIPHWEANLAPPPVVGGHWKS